MPPRISIITISLNSVQYIEQTIQSVVGQTCQDKEYIIVDGGSTDRTIEIIKGYEKQIDKWISEPDKGIADAMNKGLSLASGDYVLFLHSDDYFLDETVLAKAVTHLTGSDEIFLFDIFLSQKNTLIRRRSRGLNWWMNLKTGVFHQSAICARSLFEKIGYFDTDFRIAMDYDFFLRAYRAGIKAKKIHFPFSVMRLCGVSSRTDWPSLHARLLEEQGVHVKNCRSLGLRVIYKLYWTLYPFYKRMSR